MTDRSKILKIAHGSLAVLLTAALLAGCTPGARRDRKRDGIPDLSDLGNATDAFGAWEEYTGSEADPAASETGQSASSAEEAAQPASSAGEAVQPASSAEEAAQPADSGAGLVLSEACCANFSILEDPLTGDYEDYIELYNSLDVPVNVRGYQVADSPDDDIRVILPDITIPPYDYLVLFADNSEKCVAHERTETSPLSCSVGFKLSEGDTPCLFSREGEVLDFVELPAAHKNISMTNIYGSWIQASGTPGWLNQEAFEYKPATLATPIFDTESGFYEEPFLLSIAAEEGTQVYYTLDGSVPDMNSALYTGPLEIRDRSEEPNRVVSQPNTTRDRSGVITAPVDKGTVVRAVAYNEAGERSEAVTGVYFVGNRFDTYREHAVLSITADPEDLFGTYGIMVTGPAYDAWVDGGRVGDEPWPQYMTSGAISERDVFISLWNGSGDLVLSEKAGLRMSGKSTRERAVKRVALYARKLYSGSDQFGAPLFGGQMVHCFKTRSEKADLVAAALAEGLGIGGLGAEPEKVSVFLNGEYYTDTWLREHYDKQYFVNHQGIDKDDLALIDEGELDEGLPEDLEDFLDLIDYIEKHDAADPAVYEEIGRRMDVEGFARFAAFRLYLNDRDWSHLKNCRVWKSRKAEDGETLDGRWRWFLNDMDACGWRVDWAEANPFTQEVPGADVTYQDMPVLADLLKNPDFKALFVREWFHIMENVCTFEKVQPLLALYEIEEGTQDGFWYGLKERPVYARQHLMEALDLSEEELSGILAAAKEADASADGE